MSNLFAKNKEKNCLQMSSNDVFNGDYVHFFSFENWSSCAIKINSNASEIAEILFLPGGPPGPPTRGPAPWPRRGLKRPLDPGRNIYKPPFQKALIRPCLSLCVCVCLFVNKMPIEPLHRFWRGLRQISAYCSCSNPIEIGDLGSKVKVTVT